MTTATRSEIQRQKDADVSWGHYADVLRARVVALLAAQQRLADREPGAVYPFRQALLDLCAVCELLASELPAPTAARR